MLGLGLLLGACESEPAPTVVAEAPPARANPDAEPGASAACPDWSKTDLTSLPTLPESRHRRTFEQVWKLVLDKHYDPTLGCVDWPAARVRYGKALAKTHDQIEAFAVINEMLGELGQSHVKLFSPSSDEAVGPLSVGLQARWVGEQLVVVDAPDGAAVRPGAVLESIGKTTVDALRSQAKERVHSKAEFPSKIARLAQAKLSCAEAGAERSVGVAGRGSVALPCIESDAEHMSLGNLTHVPTSVEAEMVEGTTVGVLAFNVWMLPMLPTIEAGLAKLRAEGMTALVIDLRGNPGGVGPMSVSVARSLLTEPGSLGKLEMRAFTQEFNVTPGADPFAGPVALLIDEGTASTSEIFAAGMRDLGRVEIYGSRPSAGAALPSLIEQLDGGALFQYVVGDYHSPDGVLVEGKGVSPDHLVVETAAAFSAGQDPVLDAAVRDLQAPQAAPDNTGT